MIVVCGRTGSPQRFSPSSNVTQAEHNTKHAHYNTNIKRSNIIYPKVSPFCISLVKIKKAIHLIKFGDAGTIDRFSLVWGWELGADVVTMRGHCMVATYAK